MHIETNSIKTPVISVYSFFSEEPINVLAMKTIPRPTIISPTAVK